MILTITIPTYNRLSMLKKNISLLIKYIRRNHLEKDVCILISDNASEENYEDFFSDIQKRYKDLIIVYHRNKVNTGCARNMIDMLASCKTKYFMLLGDDDFIDERYLKKVVEILNKDKNIGSIIPSYYNIDLDGVAIDRGRDLNKKSKVYSEGFKNCFVNAWRGHQLSGLVIKNDNIYNILVERNINSLYPQIFMIAMNCINGKTYHITEYPVKVTRPPQNEKTWGYGESGLITDIFDDFKKLREINTFQRFLLELKVLDAQYWRVAMYLKKGVSSFFKCLKSISQSSNTTNLMKIMIWILIPLIFAKKGIVLLLSGKLLKTLSTQVDI